ncbi:MAG: VOC family protein [Ilumatobacteraceae bacterium]
MPDVAFKDLCIDVTAGDTRPAAVASFWAAALDQPVIPHDDGGFHLGPPEGGSKARVVWILSVPEPIAGKSRVHIDVRVAGGDPAPLVAAGGTIERTPDDEIDWHILDDPDGVAVCVFGPHPANPAALGPFELVVDAVEPRVIAQWWAERTGGTVGGREGAPFVWIEGAAGFPYMFWVFHHVPEPKTVKNRVHWDVRLVDTTIDGLVAAGATLLRPKDDEIRWWVMADPEGNEFCVFE